VYFLNIDIKENKNIFVDNKDRQINR